MLHVIDGDEVAPGGLGGGGGQVLAVGGESQEPDLVGGVLDGLPVLEGHSQVVRDVVLQQIDAVGLGGEGGVVVRVEDVEDVLGLLVLDGLLQEVQEAALGHELVRVDVFGDGVDQVVALEVQVRRELRVREVRGELSQGCFRVEDVLLVEELVIGHQQRVPDLDEALEDLAQVQDGQRGGRARVGGGGSSSSCRRVEELEEDLPVDEDHDLDVVPERGDLGVRASGRAHRRHQQLQSLQLLKHVVKQRPGGAAGGRCGREQRLQQCRPERRAMCEGQRTHAAPVDEVELAGLDEPEEGLDMVRLVLVPAALQEQLVRGGVVAQFLERVDEQLGQLLLVEAADGGRLAGLLRVGVQHVRDLVAL